MNARSSFLLLFTVVFLLLLASILTSSAIAQATSGTLSGYIADASGAIVPGVKVTIIDADRGTSVQTTSNSLGLYVRTQLPNGRYNVRAEAQGFQSSEQDGVVVNIDRETRLNITLKVGNVQQSVTVQANELPVLTTDRAEISTTLSSVQLNSLPTLGQNVTQLELLSPGTVRNTYDISAQENPQGGLANNTNGLLFGFSNRQIDGADDMDAVLGIQVVNPPPDSLDQMKVTTSNYDAEFGRAAGSFVEYSTKSGGNSYHGDLFEFLRNNYFDARDPYTEAQRQQPLRFNQFGGSFGGKIIKDKLFFFGTYQGQRQRIGSGFLESVPTSAERSGNLAALGGPNITGAVNPQAAALLNLIPQSNVPGTNFYLGTGSVKFDTNQYDARVDYYFTPNDRAFFRYDFFGSNIDTPSIFGKVAGGPSVYPAFGAGVSQGQNHNGAVNYNHVFSPTLIMNLRYSYFRYGIDVLPNDYGLNTASSLGLGGINTSDVNTSGLPNFVFTGTALSGANIPGFSSSAFTFGGSVNVNAPLHELEQLHQLSPSFTKTVGGHEIKFGGDYRWVVNYRSSSDTSRRGVYTFRAGVASPFGTTADAFESFLLGRPSEFQRFQFLGNPKEYEQDVFSFIQDRWRVSHNLTLSLGLRWEIYTAPYANRRNGANFDFNTGNLLVAGFGNVDRYTNINTRLNNFAPRLGIAYQWNQKTVIRAGYGRSFFPNFFGIQISHNYPVDFSQDVSAPVGTALPITLASGPPAATLPVVPATGELPLPPNVSAVGIPLNRKTAYVDMYNLAVQHELSKSLTAQIAYVGNQARHLYSFVDQNDPVPGPGNSNANRPYFAKYGYTQGIQSFCNCFSSNYNSLQVSVEKRLFNYYALTAQYTWSKVLNYGDNSAEFGPYDIHSQYGPAGFDRQNAFTLGHILQIPIGKGKPLLSGAGGLVENLFGGWQFTGITTVYSGRPYTPEYSNNSSLNSTFNLRAFEIADPNKNVPAGLAYNPAAFVPVTTVNAAASPYLYMEGNAGRNSLRGPRYVDADWELGKDFRLAERFLVNFAWQNFNVFNHPNRGLPNNSVDSSTAGQYTVLESFALPRTMQFSLKLSF